MKNIKAACGKFKDGPHLLGVYVKLLDDLVNIGACFQVLENG